MKSMKLYYAVSKNGRGRIFTSLPVRNVHFGIFEGEQIGFATTLFMYFTSEGFPIPDISWKDDPVELELSLKLV